MSSISNCTFVSKEEQFTKENLDKMRSLFNGKTITFENQKINVGGILKKQYGDADSDLGRRMFDIIVGRGTQGKPVHAATAYDILRMLGIKIGKTDFLGRLRMRR